MPLPEGDGEFPVFVMVPIPTFSRQVKYQSHKKARKTSDITDNKPCN